MAVPLTLPHKLPTGGDAAVKKRKAPLHGNIVKTMTVGNTTIHFCDDCIVKTQGEQEKVLKDFYAAGWRIVGELAAKGEPV